MVRVLRWNGRNVPSELRKLPAGDYVIAKFDARKLSPEEDEGLQAGLRSIDAGRTVPWETVRAKVSRLVTRAATARKKRRPA